MLKTTVQEKSKPTPYAGSLTIWPLNTPRDYSAAVAVVDRLAVKGEVNLTPAERDRLDIFSALIEDWDRRHYEEEFSQAGGPLDALRALLEAHNMSASDLGRLLGNRAMGSKILRGERQLSKSNIRRLAEHFRVSPALFL